MLKLKYDDLNQPGFKTGFEKFKKCPAQKLDAKTMFDLNKLLKKLDKHLKDMFQDWGKLVEKYSEKEESGRPKIAGNGQPVIIEDKRSEYEADMKLLLDQEFEVKCASIPFAAANNAGFTVEELWAWEPILEEMKDE